VNVPAASGDRRAKLVIWLNNGYEPSVGFGGWHTHGGFWGDTEDIARSALIDLIEDILAERYVLCEDIGGKEDGWAELLDMSEEDVLLERLTRPKTPGRVRLRSWTGQLDREVSLEDLERGTFA
ncbi:MAG TPA: hypothetical protein VNM87_10070, partial [Candidatus Udaeobacter sp.]|nr:hypothetical protein [Candidatus Udaeobacter sp.]